VRSFPEGAEEMQIRKLILGLMIAAVALCASGQTSPAGNKLPAGKGQPETARICTACHTIDTVVSQRHDRAGWQKLVDDMASRGADGTDEQFALIVDYLTKNFGPTSSSKDQSSNGRTGCLATRASGWMTVSLSTGISRAEKLVKSSATDETNSCGKRSSMGGCS
jgi:hypothetical protein